MTSSKVSIFDVARYLLNRLGSMTTMKLEKLTYYCQAWSLVYDGAPLFPEEFEAWANGPVCPQLFETHRGVFLLSSDYYGQCDPSVFTSEQIETLDAVIKDYGDKSGAWLSELTHLERPWKETRGDTPLGMKCNRVIPKSLIREYYEGIQDG